MARAGWVKPVSDRRLSDLVSVGVLLRVFPAELVDEAVAAAGRTERRHRALPARVMAYFAIGMALYSEGSYEDVLEQLTDGLSWASGGREEYPLPSKSAIFQARQRLGPEPLAELFARAAGPLAAPGAPGAWLAGRRLVSIDGTCLDVPDTPANAGFFGRPSASRGRSAFPQARVVAVAECGTRAMFAAAAGPYADSEHALARRLLDRLGPGMLLLADRGFTSYAMWRDAAATGADLLWRARTDLRPEHAADLPDGSRLARIRNSRDPADPPITVRVVEYEVDDGRGAPAAREGADGPGSGGAEGAGPARYRLFTTLLDPAEAPAAELAAAYAQRWEIETAFDELKTHQRGPRAVLRSKSPELVQQEIWGHLCCHYAIRALMAGAAEHAGRDPDRLSFTAALRIARSTVAHQGDFPP